MRKLLILIAGASLCAISYAQSSQLSDPPPADAQPAESQPQQPSLGDYARQLRLKKQQREAQLQQAKEAKENQAKGNLAGENQAKDNQAQESPAKPNHAQEASDKQIPAPAVQATEVKTAAPTSQPSPEPQIARVPHIEQTPAPGPQPKAQIVQTAAVPARATVTTASVHQTVSSTGQSLPVPTEAQIRGWKAEIQQQKSLVASLQKDITDLNNSIHLAGGNCIANCDQWNDRQKQKKQDLDTLKAQLQEQQDILAEMLEAERVLLPASAQNSR